LEELVFKARFEGGDADDHRVPAYEAVQTLYGLSRGVLIPSHYLLEGKVRHRNISSEKYKLYLQPPRAGSFEALLQFCFVAGASVLNTPMGQNVTASLISEMVIEVIKMTVGVKRTKQQLSSTDKAVPPGDMAAVAAAIEPALRQSHGIINNGVININFVSSAGGSVTLDQSTKNYINTIHREGRILVGLLSVGRYDANGKTGGAFDPKENRIIPFSVRSDIDRTSVATILKSQNDYAMGQFDPDEDGSYVAFQYERVVDSDGLVKRIEVHKVRPNIDDL
jgi:hypothetical protein